MAIESLLNTELVDIIAAHLAQLDTYLVQTDQQIRVPDSLLRLLLRLNRLMSVPPESSVRAEQDEVCDLMGELEAFLKQMNVAVDGRFEETFVGGLLAQAQAWCAAAPRSCAPVSMSEIWTLLKPAVPDCLESMPEDRYIAKWWKPVPVMDVEIILRTEGIRIHGEPYEPGDLPDGIAVCFSLIEDRR